jgi:hypothetical protein
MFAEVPTWGLTSATVVMRSLNRNIEEFPAVKRLAGGPAASGAKKQIPRPLGMTI